MLEQRAAAAKPAYPGVMTEDEWAKLQCEGFLEPMSGGVFVMSDVMTPEAWERAAREYMAKLTGPAL